MSSSSVSRPVIISVSAGASHTVCLEVSSSSTSTLYTWGSNEDGQLGHREREDIHHPKEVETVASAFSAIVCGANHTVAVAESSKEVYSWGWGDFGRLGHGDPSDRLIPAPVAALSGIAVQHVACGDSHCLVVAQVGKLFTFGRNQNGQLGLGDTQDRLKPELVRALWDRGVLVRRAAGGAEHSALTVEGGSMYTFGWGRYGNLGHGHTDDLHVPTKVMALEDQHATDPICGRDKLGGGRRKLRCALFLIEHFKFKSFKTLII